jgi:hypothetical protein
MKKLIFILIILPIFLLSQQEKIKTDDIWKPFRYFIGNWEGKGNGSPGSSNTISEWKFIFSERFLQISGKSVFDPQDKNPKGEVHEDMGLISFDKMRKKYMFRQFNIEGFVIQYTIDSISTDGKYFVLISENIENFSPDLKARVLWEILNDDEYSWKFYLAQPGKDFVCYSDNKIKRIKEK